MKKHKFLTNGLKILNNMKKIKKNLILKETKKLKVTTH